MIFKWVSPQQMLADCLTMAGRRDGKSGRSQLTEDTIVDHRNMTERASARGRRQDYLSQKYLTASILPSRISCLMA